MAAETKISWADATCNFWVGCTKVSPACDHCYAEKLNGCRLKMVVAWGPKHDRKRVKAGWALARKLQRDAARFYEVHGRRRRVFVNSLSDFFDNHRSVVWREEAWALMKACPDVIFMLLTKRPQNIGRMLPEDWGLRGYPNVWIGTTVEDQRWAEKRLMWLLDVPAALHFISYEPALGPLDLEHVAWMRGSRGSALTFNALVSRQPEFPHLDGRRIGWVIAGGESGGEESRPLDPRWILSISEQCARWGVPFHFKQWGDWMPAGGPFAMLAEPIGGGPAQTVWAPAASVTFMGQTYKGKRLRNLPEGPAMIRVGAKKAGNLLRGHRHLSFPLDDYRRAA